MVKEKYGLNQRAIDAFKLLVSDQRYRWLAVEKIEKSRLELGELKKLLKFRFEDGYHNGYDHGFRENEEIKIGPVGEMPTDPWRLSPIKVLRLCNDYVDLGRALGSWQGVNDNFENRDYQPDRELQNELIKNGLLVVPENETA